MFMKKISMIICLLAISTALFAQEQVTWGIHAGVNVANVTEKGNGVSASWSSKVGFIGGIDVQLPIAPSFLIQPELNFSQLGAKINVSDGTDYVKESITHNYLSVPILFKYKVQNTGLGIFAGPQYSYLLSAKGSGSTSVDVDESDLNGSSTDGYNRSEFSGVFGAEYYFPCNFGISARYQVGFTNIAKDAEDGTSVKNHGFTFTVGYRF